jgi:hypothetical protein
LGFIKPENENQNARWNGLGSGFCDPDSYSHAGTNKSLLLRLNTKSKLAKKSLEKKGRFFMQVDFAFEKLTSQLYFKVK